MVLIYDFTLMCEVVFVMYVNCLLSLHSLILKERQNPF